MTCSEELSTVVTHRLRAACRSGARADSWHCTHSCPHQHKFLQQARRSSTPLFVLLRDAVEHQFRSFHGLAHRVLKHRSPSSAHDHCATAKSTDRRTITEPFIRSTASDTTTSVRVESQKRRDGRGDARSNHTRNLRRCSSATILLTMSWTSHWSAARAVSVVRRGNGVNAENTHSSS